MDDNDIEFAVRYYQKQKELGGLTYEVFYAAIQEHRANRKKPNNTFNFIPNNDEKKLWDILAMSMYDIVQKSGMNMAKFARHFCIPYRTMQAWCDGTNECPIYIKLMICENMKLFNRTRTIHVNNATGFLEW